MAKRNEYVDDAYIEKVKHHLHNNLGLPDDPYVSPTRSTFNQEVVDELIHKGERWAQLESHDHVVVTDRGRFINTGRIRQYTMRFSPSNMHMYVSEEKINVPKVFEDNGWEFDIKKIKSHYIKNKWRYQDYSAYKYKY